MQGDSASAAVGRLMPLLALNPRYAITVRIVEIASQAWAYVYRSTTLTTQQRQLYHLDMRHRRPDRLIRRPSARQNLWGCLIYSSMAGTWIFLIDKRLGWEPS
jgi:hypothetical protein